MFVIRVGQVTLLQLLNIIRSVTHCTTLVYRSGRGRPDVSSCGLVKREKKVPSLSLSEEGKTIRTVSMSDCPGGNRNFNINNNAQQIVRSIAICKH